MDVIAAAKEGHHLVGSKLLEIRAQIPSDAGRGCKELRAAVILHAGSDWGDHTFISPLDHGASGREIEEVFWMRDGNLEKFGGPFELTTSLRVCLETAKRH